MRRELIAAASALALTTGVALAQGTSVTPGSGGMSAATSPTTMQHSGQLASAEQMLGKSVVGKDGKEIGEVEDVIIDPQSRQARQLVVSSGGFLGIGEKQIAIDFGQAKWNGQQMQVELSNLTQQDIEGMQEFEYSDQTTSLNRNRGDGGGDRGPTAGNTASPTSGTPQKQ